MHAAAAGAPGPADRGGRVVLVATPIGNLEDLSPRAVRALAEADVVACEDTRRTGRLLDHLGLARPLLSHHDHNERERVPALVTRAADGEVVVVVTDAGTPGVSDPGYRLVAAAAAAGVEVEAVPGPAAFLVALVVSGLPTDRFCFEGFLPRRAAARRSAITGLADEPRTVVLHLSPHRAAAELADLVAVLGPERPAALARELTKLHEEVVRASLGELAELAEQGLRGELTLVVAGREPHQERELTDEDLAALVAERVAAGSSRRDAVAAVASETGMARNRVYGAATGAGS